MDNELFDYYVKDSTACREALEDINDLLIDFHSTADPLVRGECLMAISSILETFGYGSRPTNNR